MLQDGISIVNRFSGGIDTVQPGLDTVQEFRIETNGSSARYARPATVTLASKSGTNQLHGSAFETLRNNGGGMCCRGPPECDLGPLFCPESCWPARCAARCHPYSFACAH